METHVYYGIKSEPGDEKKIVTGIRTYLNSIQRALTRSTNAAMLKARLPFQYLCFYWNLNREVGVWLELFPNVDRLGRSFLQERNDIAWILKVIYQEDLPHFQTEPARQYVEKILAASAYAMETLSQIREAT